MGCVFALSLTAALNPTLLAAVTVMLTLPSPRRLLSGYLLGAAITSITAASCSSSCGPDRARPASPNTPSTRSSTCTFGVLILLIVARVARGRDRRRRAWRERRREKAKDKPPPRWKRVMSKGSARDTFIVGIVLSFPGASYIAGMDALHKAHLATVPTVLAVLAFNVIMLALVEIPLLSYTIRPESTDAAVERFNSWLSRRGADTALIAGAAIGIFLITRGTIKLLH
jgi:Sap, sulfolipid-1-addressing protein